MHQLHELPKLNACQVASCILNEDIDLSNDLRELNSSANKLITALNINLNLTIISNFYLFPINSTNRYTIDLALILHFNLSDQSFIIILQKLEWSVDSVDYILFGDYIVIRKLLISFLDEA